MAFIYITCEHWVARGFSGKDFKPLPGFILSFTPVKVPLSTDAF